MADITITVPDGKLASLVESVGKTEEGQDDAARIVIIETWLTENTRSHLWNYERSEAANAIADPMP
jgi:hypothetical protein